MNNFDIIYLIIPFIFYSLQFTILTKYSRTEWSMQVAFYRQLGIFLVGLPLLYFFPIDFNLLMENITPILITSLIWAVYLFINFKSLESIPVAIWIVFSTTSRILLTILVWILIFSDVINIYQWIWVILLLIWVLSLLKKWNFDKKWIILSIIWWVLLVWNWYYFLQYNESFNPIIAGYILEVFNWIFLIGLLIIQSIYKKRSLKKSFKIKLKSFWIILASSPLVIIWTSAVAKSYEIFSFTIVWIVLTMMIPVSMIFWYLILKEKLTKKSFFSITFITLSIVLIKFFEK